MKKIKEKQSVKLFHGKRLLLFFCVLGVLLLFAGCTKTEKELKKIKDLEFTVVEEADIPEELLIKIKEQKATPFRITYTNAGYMYIAQGYGEQPCGGYSIAVKELFLAEDSIVFQSELIGPGENDLVNHAVTHPYIVVKVEDMGVDVLIK